MNILYSCDDKYSVYAGVSMTSLFENNKDMNEINVYIAGQNISGENIGKLNETAKNYGRNLVILDIDTEKINKLMYDGGAEELRGNMVAYFRLFVDELFGNSISRILYLDSDTIVVGSLSDIESFTFETDKACAMVKDPAYIGYNKMIGLDESDLYYNSGVLLIDLDNWRKLKCNDKIMQAIKEGNINYKFHDQDMLNVILNKNIQTLDFRYNILSNITYFGSEVYRAIKELDDHSFYSSNEIKDAIDNPVILHVMRDLTGAPWQKGNYNPYNDVWRKYKAISLWSDKDDEQNDLELSMYMQRALLKVLPKKLYIYIHKLYNKMTVKDFKMRVL